MLNSFLWAFATLIVQIFKFVLMATYADTNWEIDSRCQKLPQCQKLNIPCAGKFSQKRYPEIQTTTQKVCFCCLFGVSPARKQFLSLYISTFFSHDVRHTRQNLTLWDGALASTPPFSMILQYIFSLLSPLSATWPNHGL